MIKIEAPEAYELVGLGLAQDARQQFPDREIGQRNCIIFTPTVGSFRHVWAVWRIKSGWMARWLRYEGDEGGGLL